MFEFREINNESEYNPLLIDKNASFVQAWFFGKWQEFMGRKALRFEIKNNAETIGFFQAIKYPMPFGQNFLYVPHGPVLINDINRVLDSAEFLDELRKELFKIGKEEKTAFIRFDPFPKIERSFNKCFRKVPAYAYRSSYFQPKLEWILDLEKTEEELLKAMHSKTRYNINLAAKKGVKIQITSGSYYNYFNNFYRLIEETAKRDDFNLHPKNYYENIFKTLDSSSAFLTVAKHDNKILAVNLILLFGNTAYFLYGGSSDEYKNLMAPHLAHWKGILEVKRRNCKFYNFGAIGARQYEGISRFKKGFGGKLLEYSDSYDLIIKPFCYNLYRFTKSIRQTLYFGDKVVDK